MSINTLLTNIQTAIVEAIPQLKERHVTIHGGRVTAKTLKSHALANRAAVLLAALKVTSIRYDAGERWGEARFIAFVSALDKPGEKNFARAADLTEAVVGVVHNNNFDACAENPEKLTATNLHSIELEKEGVSLWGVTWDQYIKLADYTPEYFDWITSEINSEPEPGPAVSSVITTEEG